MSERNDDETAVRGVRFAQDRSRETLRRILDAAREVFLENGYDKTTIAEIISRAGIGHGTFWLYFHNKDDLIRYMTEEFINEFEAFEWFGDGNLEGYPVRSLQEVEQIIGEVMEVFVRYSSIHPLIVKASLESEDFRNVLEELNKPFVQILERKLREHLDKGYCKDLDPEVTAIIIVSMLEYSNLQWLNSSPSEWEALIHNLSVIIYHTLNHAQP
jgi:AcrR family transcriptional regulator